MVRKWLTLREIGLWQRGDWAKPEELRAPAEFGLTVAGRRRSLGLV